MEKLTTGSSFRCDKVSGLSQGITFALKYGQSYSFYCLSNYKEVSVNWGLLQYAY